MGITKASAVATINLDKYTGVYSNKNIPIKLTFTNEDKSLQLEATGQEKIALANTGKDSFGFEAVGLVIVFDLVKNELTLSQGGGNYVFTKDLVITAPPIP